MNRILKITFLLLSIVYIGHTYAMDLKSHISIKQPGNDAVTYNLTQNDSTLSAIGQNLPVQITQTTTHENNGETAVTITIKALDKVYFNFGMELNTGLTTDDCDFYLPGFWYHKNLRSPKEAPSFHTSKSWNVREDRLSTPLTGLIDLKTGNTFTVLRDKNIPQDALTPLSAGEAILSDNTSIGYLGFDNETGKALLTFGYPYIETPTRYTRKLTLTPAIYTFAKLEKGETKTITWRIKEGKASGFSKFVANTWTYCFDSYFPQPLKPLYTPEQVKEQLTNYFRKSYVDSHDIKFNSGLGLLIDKCTPVNEMQIGFCGRALLNAFNEIEYGESHNQKDLVNMGRTILQSFLDHGFTPANFFYDHILFDQQPQWEGWHSIRQQSEAIYAILHFLKYDKLHGKRHIDWETKIRTLLNNLIKLQNSDGSFARKFKDDGSVVDGSGGSTPSATSAFVMAYKYFGDSKYLTAAKRTVGYLDEHIISKSDYFSSTLDANCEDKEAAISAVTATYYMALVSKGEAQKHYINLCHEAAYFALSWYYTWDVPFAQGQMLGDLGFKTRGWGNVSVENNHVDVFVFEFPTILKWLGEHFDEKRFVEMHDVIYSSLDQLLPTKDRLCGIAIPGFNPEVVQHTNWDYGQNGKGFYNNYFAPGWTIASLWELYSPNRTSDFFRK